MWLAPAFHQGRGRCWPTRHARSSSSPRCISRLRAGARPLPLPPQEAAQFAPQPAIQFLEARPSPRPAGSSSIQPRSSGLSVLDGRGQDASASGAQQLPHLVLQPLHALPARSADRALLVPRHAVAQELPLPRSGHRALARVDRAAAAARSRNRVIAAITRSPAAATAHVDVAVVGVAAERSARVVPVPGPDRRAGCSTAAARAARLAACPPFAAASTPPRIIPASQVAADQPQHPLVADLAAPPAPSARRG